MVASLLILLTAHVSRAPTALHEVSGTVVAISDAQPSGHPKLNVFVRSGTDVIRLYTDLYVLSRRPAVGDTIDAEYEDDFLGRNFHRFWALRVGDDVLMSKAASMASAADESRKIVQFALGCFAFGVLIIGIGILRKMRALSAP